MVILYCRKTGTKCTIGGCCVLQAWINDNLLNDFQDDFVIDVDVSKRNEWVQGSWQPALPQGLN